MVRNSEWGREDPTAADDERFGDIIESTTPANAGEYDAVLFGEPYDGGTTGRAGAREAPAAIRDALAGIETHHLDAGPVDSVGDLGTVEISANASVSAAREAVRDTVDKLHDADTIPVILGGSGSLTYANVAGLLEATAVTDGGGYLTDGGFGEDEESVGDVEHFDPSGAESTDEDGDSETADDEEADETEETDDSDADDSAEAEEEVEEESEADEESTEDDESESETDDEESEGDETAEDAADEEDEEQDDEGGEEAADDEDDEAGEEAAEDDETDETVEEDDDEPAEEDAEDSAEETAESTDDDAANDDTDEESAVDDTAFATPDGETETAVIEETTGVTGSTETADESPERSEAGNSSATSATGSVGVISLDARLDCRADGEPTNRSGYRELFDAGLDALAVLGARHFESSTAEAEYLRDRDGMVVTAEEVGDDPVEAADRAFGAVEEVEQIYVSIDLSVLDSTAAPGVSAPAPGGLSTRELFRVVRLLASDERIAGFELVEAVPALDREDRTVEAAARTVAHAVASTSQ